MLKHFPQEKHYSCGAAAYRILLSDTIEIDEKTARKECYTRASGTHSHNVTSALRKRGLDANYVYLNVDFIEYSRWLKLNSMGRKLYLSCEYRDHACNGYGKRSGGRDRERNHAVTVCNGYVYDPSEPKPCPVEAYMDVFTKRLTIKSMILVDIN